MTSNTWMVDSRRLADAYRRHNLGVLGLLRQRLLSRAIAEHIGAAHLRVADIGGGEGHQTLSMAQEGHDVVLLDPDPAMLAKARERAAAAGVTDRMRLVQGYGEDALELLPAEGFDFVCCHGISMYLDDPVDLIGALSGLLRVGGRLSFLALNADTIALRAGLEGRWVDALRTLETGVDTGGRNLPYRPDRRQDVESIMYRAGVQVTHWYGVRIFSDHLGDAEPASDFEDLVELEWTAGSRDPYRALGRLFHLIGTKA